MSSALATLEPPVIGHWQCFTAPVTGVPPTSTPRLGLDGPDPDRCPSCSCVLATGVIEVSTGITERRQLCRTSTGWQIGQVEPECFGETWYECAACGAMLPEAISRRIAAELY